MEGDCTRGFDSPEGTLQSAIPKSDPLAVPTSYVRVATAGLALTGGRARFLGCGVPPTPKPLGFDIC
jgi:spermidine synthase